MSKVKEEIVTRALTKPVSELLSVFCILESYNNLGENELGHVTKGLNRID